MKTIYTFREITVAQELERWLRLRYEIFTNSLNRPFVHENRHRIDLDQFDLSARHFGLWQGNQKIAYLRVVHPKSNLVCRAAVCLKEGYPVAEIMQTAQPTAPFPFLSYPDVPKSYWHYYKTAIGRGEQFLEGSRLIVQPEHRGLKLTQWLLTCVLSLYLTDRSSDCHTVVCCQATHRAFYEAYGFEPIGGINQYMTYGLPKVSLVMRGDSILPAYLQDELGRLANEFRINHTIERAL